MANGFKQEVISIIKNIAPGEKMTISERIKGDGTIQEVRVRFVPGPEGDLLVRPYVRHKPDYPEELLTYPDEANRVLSGDDDYFVFPVIVAVQYDDFFCIDVQNLDANYSYPCIVHAVVDYYGGKDRVIGGVIGG